jgi:glycosyltransferase involved in cell wall biosynthesis
MAEIPVIVSDVKEMAKMVRENEIGVVVESLAPQGIVDAIHKLQSMNYSDLQMHLRKAKKQYCWEVQEKTLILEYKKLLG